MTDFSLSIVTFLSLYQTRDEACPEAGAHVSPRTGLNQTILAHDCPAGKLIRPHTAAERGTLVHHPLLPLERRSVRVGGFPVAGAGAGAGDLFGVLVTQD